MNPAILNSSTYPNRSTARVTSYRSTIWLAILSLLLFGSATYAQTNHPPTISWLPDQRILPAGTFAKQYFRAWDNETPLTASNITSLSAAAKWIELGEERCRLVDGRYARAGWRIDWAGAPRHSGLWSGTGARA